MMKTFYRYIATIVAVFTLSAAAHADEIENLNAGIGVLADKIVKQMQANQVKLIAMGNFDNSNGRTQFERNVEIGLVNSIVGKNLKDISVIERKNLSEVLKEQKLGSTGLLAKNTRAKLGEILGVDAIVTAETTVLKRNVTVNVRMYSIATGRILAAPSYTFLRSETIDELLAQEAEDEGLQILETDSHIYSHKKRKPYKQKSSTCFANNYIQGCSKISRSKDHKRVTVTTVLENITDTDIFLGQITTCNYENDNYCTQENVEFPKYSTINCELAGDGKTFTAKKVRGVATFFRRWIDRDKINVSNLTSLNKKSKISISYSFISDKEPIEGEYFDFSADAVMYYPNGKEKHFKKEKITISGTNLYLPNKK